MKSLSPLLTLLLLILAQAQAPAQNVENLLRPGDSIVLKLSGVPTEEITVVSNTYDISDNGTINLPYIGELHASGMRPSMLQKAIENAYKNGQIYTHPTILVSANRQDNSSTQLVYVSGEVKNPGRFQMSPGMTVLDAITSAGGPTDFASMKRVKLTRNGSTRELDFRKVDSAAAALQALPGDKVYVPK